MALTLPRLLSGFTSLQGLLAPQARCGSILCESLRRSLAHRGLRPPLPSASPSIRFLSFLLSFHLSNILPSKASQVSLRRFPSRIAWHRRHHRLPHPPPLRLHSVSSFLNSTRRRMTPLSRCISISLVDTLLSPLSFRPSRLLMSSRP